MEQKDDNKEVAEEVDMPNNYRPSLSSGIYGSYVLINTNEHNEIHMMEEEKIDYHAQIQAEIQVIASQPEASRDSIFKLAKKTYKQQGKPVVIDTKNTLNTIRENAQNYKNVALPMTLARDVPFNEWSESQFKQEFSQKFDIPIECITIISVKAGSQIIDLKLETHSNDNKLIMPIECIAENISNEKAKKALVEFGIFAMEFGEITTGFDNKRQRVIMNPQWNREYGPGYTDWDGPLNDGKSRGNEPYFCPKGWKRFAIQFQQTAYDFANVYDNWPIAYHGTKFDCSMMISLSGLLCSKGYPPFGAHGPGVYLSPSIKYVSHPRYCEPVKLDLNKVRQMKEWKDKQITQSDISEFNKYDGKWIQCAFMCRVKPGLYRKCRETMGLGVNGDFDGIPLSKIEWIVDGPAGTLIGNDKILIYGIMIRARDRKQTGYDDYE